MERPSGSTRFVCTTYIHATLERVRQGLTDRQLTARLVATPLAGGKSFLSDWKPGSTYEMVHPEVGAGRERSGTGDRGV